MALLENRGPPLSKKERAALSPFWKKKLNFTLVTPEVDESEDASEEQSEVDSRDGFKDLDINSKMIQEVLADSDTLW